MAKVSVDVILVEIHHIYLTDRIAIVHDDYWIGLNDRSQSNVYSWIQSNSQVSTLKEYSTINSSIVYV